ncbi:MAG: Trehalose transport system permease protein SugA [Firmicutes bacterium ADurb.Bin182]|nr:MAG: Trehalose transport system permease protein SugA [Firmicutes bacterium ADurb.Bin182]
MRRRMSARQFAFVFPLLLLIGVFSLFPIFSSFVYTLFDYRTNDQAAAGLFFGGNLNRSLYYEDLDYIIYFLEDDVTLVDETGKAEFSAIMQDVSKEMETYADGEDTIKLGSTESRQISAFIDDVERRIAAVYEKHPEIQFYNKEKIPVLTKEMRSCIIPSNFTGFEAYGKLLSDKRFGNSLLNTFIFTLVSVSFELVLGMGLALIMNKAVKGIGLVRAAALIPWAVPTAVAALMWSYLYDGGSGIIAELFTKLGLISSRQSLLNTAGGAMSAAILADVWKTTPYMALLLLAGLQVIEPGLYESSSIDGAGKVRTFFSITLPMLKPSILVALLFRTLDAFRVYDLIAVLTGGGPGGATETLSIYSYKVMISQSNYGYGSVIVVAMFLCVALIAFIFIKVLGAELISDE